MRYDDLSTIMVRTYALGRARADGGAIRALPWLPRSHSGRRFVIVAGLVFLVMWALLFLAFREWRARYRERAAFGASLVEQAIGPMAEVVPPGVDTAAWRDAVSQTRALLVTVTASNLLSTDEMLALRAELDQSVARARTHPETAIQELAGVWDTIAERAGFLLKDSRSPQGNRHPRPKILIPAGPVEKRNAGTVQKHQSEAVPNPRRTGSLRQESKASECISQTEPRQFAGFLAKHAKLMDVDLAKFLLLSAVVL